MSEFLHMGGYGGFIWPSYALGLVLLVAHAALPLIRRRRLLNEIARRLRRDARAAAKAANDGSEA